MIPRQSISCLAEIPDGYKFWTPRREDICEEGFGFFRGTWLIRGVWIREARRCLQAEAELVAAIDQLAGTAEEFDEIALALETCEIEELPAELTDKAEVRPVWQHLISDQQSPLGGLEVGVAGLVHALSATGFWPAASCRGHPAGWARYPVVYIAGDRHRVSILRHLAEAAHCGFSVDPARDQLLVVEAGSVEDAMLLGRTVLEAREDLVPRRRPRCVTAPPADQMRLDLG